MSAVVNARDVLLQASGTRLGAISNAFTAWLTNEAHTVPADSAGAVVSYAGATGDFNVFSNGTDISTSFTLSTQANPQTLTVGYVGRTYTISGGLDAGEDNATVTIRATGNAGTVYSGVVIDKVFSLGKSRTGATGATGLTGSTGTRGSITASGSGSAWSDATADSAITTFTGASLKVTGDIVTISNGTNFAQSRYWNGTAWVTYAAKYSGDVIVQGTITTDRLVANAATVATNDDWQSSIGSIATTQNSQQVDRSMSVTTTGARVKWFGSLGVQISGPAHTNVAYYRVTVQYLVGGLAVDSVADEFVMRDNPSYSANRAAFLVPLYRSLTPASGTATYTVRTLIELRDASGTLVLPNSTVGYRLTVRHVVEENKV